MQTTAEVYSSLAKQGFAVQYCRVPVTDGTAPTVGGKRAGVKHLVGGRAAQRVLDATKEERQGGAA